MEAFCETCSREVTGVPDEHDMMVCIKCGTDLVVGLHVDDPYLVSPQELEDIFVEEGFKAFPTRD